MKSAAVMVRGADEAACDRHTNPAHVWNSKSRREAKWWQSSNTIVVAVVWRRV